jgi:hypothetical protein
MKAFLEAKPIEQTRQTISRRNQGHAWREISRLRLVIRGIGWGWRAEWTTNYLSFCGSGMYNEKTFICERGKTQSGSRARSLFVTLFLFQEKLRVIRFTYFS